MTLLKQLNGEDDRSIENLLSSTTEMYGAPFLAVQFEVDPKA